MIPKNLPCFNRLLSLVVLLALFLSCDSEDPPPPPTYTLSTSASPSEDGQIMVSPAASTFNEGQSVTLTPEANPNWVFSQWEEDASGSASPLTMTMNTNKSVTGVFVKRDSPLNITVEGEGTVSEEIVTNPSARDYPHGTTVELTPVPAEGWVFESWGGDLSGNEVPERIT
ncbi:MAG: hypothetical protein WD431_10270, partial [Cyclobacteriaceae bacterium]